MLKMSTCPWSCWHPPQTGGSDPCRHPSCTHRCPDPQPGEKRDKYGWDQPKDISLPPEGIPWPSEASLSICFHHCLYSFSSCWPEHSKNINQWIISLKSEVWLMMFTLNSSQMCWGTRSEEAISIQREAVLPAYNNVWKVFSNWQWHDVKWHDIAWHDMTLHDMT